MLSEAEITPLRDIVGHDRAGSRLKRSCKSGNTTGRNDARLKRNSDIKADCFTDKVELSRFTQTGIGQSQNTINGY